MDIIHREACERLEQELCRVGGVTTILVVGERLSGKTTVCETVMRRMGRHVVRWTPYQEFVAGQVSGAYTGLDTIVFVDDADVLVRLTKGSSVGLMDAMQACSHQPGMRILMTALDTKGRVWRSVASKAGVVQLIPSGVVRDRVRQQTRAHGHAHAHGRIVQSEDDAWRTVLMTTEHAEASKRMRNWCDARDADADLDAGADVSEDPDVGCGKDWNSEDEADGCIVRKIARILSTHTHR